MIEWKEPFLQLICTKAAAQGKVFFPYSAQGNEMVNPPDDLEVEDWNGWLVDPNDAPAFEKQFMQDRESLFDDDSLPFVTASWKQNDSGGITVTFDEE